MTSLTSGGPRSGLRLVVLASLVVLAACSTPASRAVARPSTASVRHVLGLGDSVTAGSACGCVDFVRLLAHELSARTGHAVSATNRGRGGQTSAQLLALVRGDDDTRADVRGADTVLVTIGANDLLPALQGWDDGRCDEACARRDVGAVTARVADVVREVLAIRAGRPTRVLVTDYWNVFEDGDVARADRGEAYLGWSDRLTRAFDAALCPKVVAAGATCLDLYAPFKAADGSADPTALLAGDGDHPNAAGHALIARLMLAQLTSSSRR